MGRTASVRTAVELTFADYVNHYKTNPWLGAASPQQAYADWTARSVGDANRTVMISRGVDGAVAAISVVERRDQVDEILLAGVMPFARGRGTYSAYLDALVDYSYQSGAASVVISTQDHNVAVQRLWCRGEFEPLLGVTIVHGVSPEWAAAKRIEL